MTKAFSLIKRKLSTKTIYKTFKQIPGPVALPFIGTLWKYFPVIGDYSWNKLHLTGEKKLQQYGNIVKEIVAPGVKFVNVFHPDDIETVFKVSGKSPERRSHLALEYYRNSRPRIYSNTGLLPTNGKIWWNLRKEFQKSVSPIHQVRLALSLTDEITNEFINNLIEPNTTSDDLANLLSRLNLELTWMIMFGERLHSFDAKELNQNSETSKLISWIENINDSILKTDMTQDLWKKYKTKSYKFFEINMINMENKIMENLEKARSTDENNRFECLITTFLKIQNYGNREVIATVIDLILGGMDTTAYTSCFLLYHLSKNEKSQEILREEILKLLPSKTAEITLSALNSASYAKAVLKESLRLNPVSAGTSRILQEDTILSGYIVPKESIVMTQNMVACRQNQFFKNALEFKPERWLRNSPEYCHVSPYLVLPFGYGLRSCIARRRAEQNMLVLIMNLLRLYKISWNSSSDLDIVTPLINKPAEKVRIKFETI